MTEPIMFKSFREEKEWMHPSISPLLQTVVIEFAEEAYRKHGWLPLITSILRTREEDMDLKGSGIHCLGRAADVRTKTVKDETVDDMGKWCNSRWVYDPKRPHLMVAFYKTHGAGPHIHFQVCDRTRRKA